MVSTIGPNASISDRASFISSEEGFNIKRPSLMPRAFDAERDPCTQSVGLERSDSARHGRCAHDALPHDHTAAARQILSPACWPRDRG
jgi:hypothetical protein